MQKIIKNTLILTAITVVAGLLLGIVYGITEKPIAASQEKAKQEAFQAVLKDAASFETYKEFDADVASSLDVYKRQDLCHRHQKLCSACLFLKFLSESDL